MLKLNLCLAVLTATCKAADPVRATLTPDPSRPGAVCVRFGIGPPVTNLMFFGGFILHVANVSTNTIVFLDPGPSASGWSGDFFEVAVDKKGTNYTSRGFCGYASMGMPRIVELPPRQTYERSFDAVAHIAPSEFHMPPCSVSVTYRVSEKMKKRLRTDWAWLAGKADLDFTFRTDTIAVSERIEASHTASHGTALPRRP
ncbi:MAG: hypothetical protein FJ225_03355 [Lentisphaerae bacterium]|nr:hypothetical protein [Lentisphaerota bacterium]